MKLDRETLKKWAGPVAAIVLGGFLLLNPDFGTGIVGTALGWILVAFSAIGLYGGIMAKEGVIWGRVILSTLGLCLGITLLKNPLAPASLLGLGLGILLLVNGLRSLSAGEMLFGGLTAILGLLLIFSPMTASQILMRICGAAVMIWGVSRLILTNKRLPQPEDPNIVDAEE